MYRISSFLQHFAWAMIGGSLLASVWLNLDPASYYDVIEYRVFSMRALTGRSDAIYTFHDFVAYVLMPMFLFCLAKELWESLRLDRGAMRHKRGGLPVLGGIGAMMAVAITWIGLGVLFPVEEGFPPTTGWALLMGSDVVLTYLCARLVFRPNSPALHILLLLTIVTSLGGLFLSGLADLDSGPRLIWLGLPLFAAVAVWFFAARHLHQPHSERQRQLSLRIWPYLLAMLVSWLGVAASGLPPGLGLLPILPVIPHARQAFGMFAEAEELLHDPLNRIAHGMVIPLVPAMFLFGFTHGGIDTQSMAPISWNILACLWLAKPLGVIVGALLVAPRLGYRLPQNMGRRHVWLIALLSTVSFTMPLLALDRALPGGYLQEAARLAFALSFAAGLVAIFVARSIRRLQRR